jgi:O-acetyl-ADP-ribose deacetylase
VAATAGRLPARWVIHTVGPVYSVREDRSPVLASCYAESLRVAEARFVLFTQDALDVFQQALTALDG